MTIKELSIGEFEAGLKKGSLFASNEPFLVRNLVSKWPLVQQAKLSSDHFRDYLLSKAIDRSFTVSFAPEDVHGRIGYRDDMKINFEEHKASLDRIFQEMKSFERNDTQPLIYTGSIDIKKYFDGLFEENQIANFGRNPRVGLWMGLRTQVPIHNDFPDNLACNLCGRRKFTLFPPDQFKNLYLGPIDYTPAGRSISMVDINSPDFARFPNYKLAEKEAKCVELAPGDAVHIPSMWWHSVEGLDGFNAMLNFWWRESPMLGDPDAALVHAIYAWRDLPNDEREIWRELLDHYVFGDPDAVRRHIPTQGQGILARLDGTLAQKIKTFLLNTLNK